MGKTLANAADREEILARMRRLAPDSARRWGRMTPHQAVCHLNDSLKTALGGRDVSPTGTIFHRTFVKWIALRSPAPWPKGVATRPEIDQERGGTRPTEFARDVAEFEALLGRFTASPRDFEFPAHPIFGRMSERDWMAWGYRHADHHLRQFGVDDRA